MIPTPADAALMLSQSAEIALLAKATAFLLAGLIAVALARRARASVRHLILAATFAAIAATPVLINSVPETRIAVPIAAATVPAEPPVTATVRGPAAAQVPIATPAGAPFAISSRTILLGGWLIGSMLFLGPVLTTLWKLRTLRRTALPCSELSEPVLSLARESGIGRHIDVLQHESVASPITFGVWRPVILMPTGASQWDDADLRRALTHEIEHIRRSDWAVHLTARTTAAVYWFHPLAWIAWRQLVLEAEQSCDDAVVAHDERTDYAEQLVTLAQRLTTATGPALGMAHRSDLAARVSALLDDARPRGPVGIRIAALTIASATVIVFGLAPLRAVGVAQGASMNQPPTSNNQVAVTVPLSYQRDQQVLFGDEVVSLATLADRLRQTRATAVILRGDKQVQLQALMQVMDQLKTAGVEQVAIVDRPEKPRRLRALDNELVEAAQSGDLEDVKDLIDAGASVDATVQGDGSPLIVASRANRLAVVAELLNRGADVNLAVLGDGNPLIAAAAAGAEKIVDLLLSRGAAIDLIVPGDENALIQAAGAGHFAIVKMLVDRGADVNARVWADRSAYPKATARQVPSGDDGSRGEWRTPLGEARKEHHGAIVAFLLQAGAHE